MTTEKEEPNYKGLLANLVADSVCDTPIKEYLGIFGREFYRCGECSYCKARVALGLSLEYD